MKSALHICLYGKRLPINLTGWEGGRCISHRSRKWSSGSRVIVVAAEINDCFVVSWYLQNDTHPLAPSSLQLLQQLQATSSAATPVGANAGANALTSVQHQLLLQQHLGLGAATPAQAAQQSVPSPPEISSANLQGLATLASLNSAGEYG